MSRLEKLLLALGLSLALWAFIIGGVWAAMKVPFPC
jgi:uncharacterized protein YneF (UPF0154 family)